MTLPALYPNGTSTQMLAASAEAAYDALQMAYELLRQTAPNARDFYVQPSGAFEKAVAEHHERQQHIAQVMTELDELIGHCEKGGRR